MWACYKVYLEAKAPIHVGYGARLGIVDRTRYYIPARNVWGALTNLVARSVMKDYRPKAYQRVGEFLNENIKFSYFYPVEYRRRNGKIEVQQVFAPCYTKSGLRFGVCKNREPVSSEEFEQMFISSFVSTALDKTSRSAEEGSLHEIEFIKDKIKQDEGIKPTIFIGYLFVKNTPLKLGVERGKVEIEISFTSSIEVGEVKLNEIWIGGERNYGFGKVKILLESSNKDEIDLFDSGMVIDTTKEQLTVSGESEHFTALSHVNIENLDAKLIRGDIEPLVGRDWSERGSGQKITQIAKICIAPGSLFACDSDIVIEKFGIWNILT